MNSEKMENWDLEERTAKFGEDIIRFCKKIPKNPITVPLINQLVRAGTSVGANYAEADDAESKKDFKHKIGIVKIDNPALDGKKPVRPNILFGWLRLQFRN